ncbi:DUF4360 domain-containing protein [Actinoplanes sp. NPDC023801]|uniref:DUF4360 domain-containing protein n=1 Tax=Actinoplanes sp. NPDC023801 TaxID=3154595 RepID=UPI0033FABC62
MFNVLAAGSAFLASLVMSASAAPAPPPGGKTTVKVVSALGSGCPAGSGGAKALPGKGSFTVAFPDFTASSGGDALERRKNCQLLLDVRVPRGYTYAVSRVTVHGSGKLGPAGRADLTTQLYFQGHSETDGLRHEINGPLNGKWQRDDRISPKARQFRPCGENRYLAVNVSLMHGGSGGFVSADGRLGLEFARKKC